MLDTMKVADNLREAGFDERRARAIVRAQAEGNAQYATKTEVGDAVARLDARIDGMDKWLKFVAVGMAAVLLQVFLG